MKKRLTKAETKKSTAGISQKVHGSKIRGLDSIMSSFFPEGRFGRMFRNAPVYEHKPDNLAALAQSMIVPLTPLDTGKVVFPVSLGEQENPLIPSGYVYLGQFIDHDITFDPASSLQRQNDPNALHNFRTPRFDLDCLYGRGPSEQPYLYLSADHPLPHPKFGFDQRGIMFLLDERDEDGEVDLPRNANGRALVGDPRNDENLIVSQLHTLFLKFHNRMVEYVFENEALTGRDLFLEAQRFVRWHYQWIIVHDFLPRILNGSRDEEGKPSTSVVDDILTREVYATGDGKTGSLLRAKLRFFQWQNLPYLPVEFSVAAYRFGHSMVRPSYFFNDFVREQTQNIRTPLFSASNNPLDNLNGFRPLPAKWGFQWKYFFDTDPTFAPQHSFKIDTKISNPLSDLPGHFDMANLAQRNLIRGLMMNLPSGQSVARAMGIEPLADADLGLTKRGAPDFEGDAPLWFYILREAEVLADGLHLGPVGGRIVGEVLVGLLAGDPLSWFNIEPNWQPPMMKNERFGMPELIAFTFGEQSESEVPPDSKSDAYSRWCENFPVEEKESSPFVPKNAKK